MAEKMRQQAAEGQAKYESWQKEQQKKTGDRDWNQFKNMNKGKGFDRAYFEKYKKANFGDFKKWFNEQVPNTKSGPDPFFQDFKKSSESNPDQAYYKDLMKKIFMVTGGLILLRLITGGVQDQGRSVNPQLEQDYMY